MAAKIGSYVILYIVITERSKGFYLHSRQMTKQIPRPCAINSGFNATVQRENRQMKALYEIIALFKQILVYESSLSTHRNYSSCL